MAIVEGSRLQSGDSAFTLFSILFEIVSAYGTVGLSLGYPTNDASLSAEFHVLSKLIVVAMMIRGRHRGLPYSLDKAILLPSEGLQKKEEEEASKRLARRASLAPSFQMNGATRVSTNGSAKPAGGAGGGEAYAYHNGMPLDLEKAPDDDGEPMRTLPPIGTNEKGDVSEWNSANGRNKTKKEKLQGGLGKLVNQLFTAGPNVKRKMYDYGAV